MIDHQDTPEQEMAAAFQRELDRVGVDGRNALPRLRASTPPLERVLSDTETEVTLTIDVSAILETLRSLPDRAGTEAFVEAHNNAHRDWPVLDQGR